MKEYELYVPLNYNDGRPIEMEKLAALKRQLTEEFGGLTHFPQENEGRWKVGAITFRDRIVILRVLASRSAKAESFFVRLKKRMKSEWQQADVLVVERRVEII
jgi:hypothetical protein